MTFRELCSQIKEDWAANGKDWSRPGFRALAVYRFGVWRMSIGNKFVRAPFSVLYRFLFCRIRNGYSIELPYSAQVGRRLVIEHQGAIVIHGDVRMGNDCIIRQGVTIGNRDSLRPYDAPVLGDRVNVGAGAKLLGAISIGDDACIGANAVVVADVAADTTVVGIPARPIKSRSAHDALAPTGKDAVAPTGKTATRQLT